VITRPRPLPLPVPLEVDEPALSLLRRLATRHGLALAALCRHLGEVAGDPSSWQAVTLNAPAAAALARANDVALPTLLTHVPNLIDPTFNGHQASLVRRPVARNWLGGRPGSCASCQEARRGAAGATRLQPWVSVCRLHGLPLRPGPRRCRRGLPELARAQVVLDKLVAAHGSDEVRPRVFDAYDTLDRHRSDELNELALDRASRSAGPCKPAGPVPALATETWLFPELVARVQGELLAMPSASISRLRPRQLRRAVAD
jgi:hypothetical protein